MATLSTTSCLVRLCSPPVSLWQRQAFLPSLPCVPLAGPDICGPGTKKVHVIFNYKGKNVLINKDIRCKVGWGLQEGLVGWGVASQPR